MKLPYKRCSPQSSGNSGKAAGGGRHTSTSQRWMHSRHSSNGNRCPCASWARPYWRDSKTSSGRGIVVGIRCPPILKQYARFTTGQWTESWCDMYPDCLNMCIPVHEQIGRKRSKLPTIGSLVRETEMNLQAGNSPNTRQKTKIFFVLMFMLRGIPFVDLAYLHKRDLQGNTLSYRRRKTGRALTVSLTPEAMQMVRIIANKDKDSPYLFPHITKVRKAQKRHTGNTSRHSGHSTSVWQYSDSVWECSRHSAPMRPDIPGPQWLTIARYTPESYRKPWGTPPSRWRKPIWSLSATERLTRPIKG